MSATSSARTTTSPSESREQLIGRLGAEIAELEAHVTAAVHRQLIAIRDFDHLGGWADEGATSCAAWLTWRIGLSAPAARERVRVARALAELPLTSATHARGEVSFSQVRALTRIATPENEAHWLGIARHSTAQQLERIIQKTRRALACRQPDQHAVEQEARSLVTHIDLDGMLVIRARLPAEAGAAFEKALAAFEVDPSREDETRVEGETRDQRRADALVAMADHARSGGKPVSGADRHTVVVHVDAGVLSAKPSESPEEPTEGRCELESEEPVPAGTAQRLACDCGIIWMRHKPGAAGARPGTAGADVGRKGRTVPTRLGRAVHERDKGCRFPGCSNRLTDAHHVIHWAHGGRTDLENLCSLCRRHHTYVHEGRFEVESDGRGGFIFRTPTGAIVTPGSVLPEVSARRKIRPDTLQALHEAMDMSFHAGTFICDWDGERPDYAYIAEVMAQFSPSSAAA